MGWLAVRRADIATLVAGLLVALAAGAATALEPLLAAAAIAAGGLLFLAAVLGAKAFPWFLVLFAVIPYYSPRHGFLVPPVVPVAVIALLAGAILAMPWAWALLQERERRRRWRPVDVVLAVLIGCTALAAYAKLGATELLDPVPAGLLVGATAFFAGQRFSEARDWGLPTVAGLAVLLSVGGVVYANDPDNRLGFFAGYPILYAALIVALLPAALTWSWRRSRTLCALLLAASAVMLVLSQTRSAWIAVGAMLLMWAVLIVKFGRWRELGLLLAVVVLATALIGTSETLSDVVSTRLSAAELGSESATHRQSIYGYAYERLLANPVLGLGYPGGSKDELRGTTGIGATDNGFLAVGADMGVVGLGVVLTPLVAGCFAVVRLLRRTRLAGPEAALALGLLGVLVLTTFFDTFYWLQSSLLVFALAGVLSARLRPGADRRPGAPAAA